MKIFIPFIALLTVLHAAEPIALFNGKDLSGWTVQCLEKDANKKYWSAKDGTITVDTKGDKKHNYVWLIHDQEFADFDLTFKIKELRPTKGNSGIQIRSRYTTHPTGKGMWMHGPQIDIHPPTPYRTGLIYDETFETRHWIHPKMPSWKISPADASHKVSWSKTSWNTLRIRAVGTHIQTWLNGLPVSDFSGAGVLDDKDHKKHKVGLAGQVALQLHANDDLALQFKDILLTPVPKNGPSTPGT